MENRNLPKKTSAPVDELYNLENYEDAELYEILGLPADFAGDDQTLSNAILKQIQKFSTIEPGQENNSSEAKKMAQFFLNIYDYFFPNETVADGTQNASADVGADPDPNFDIASNYTDEELFDLLGLDNPSDQLLEAKLTLLISQYAKYKNDNNQSEQKQLYLLYKQIYDHFFSGTDDNVERAQNKPRSTVELNDEITRLREQNTALSNQLASTPTSRSTPPESDVGYTKPLDYSKGVLNPILKQTIRRVISIDSQYRSDKTKLPTEFTFNLSEPLRDVVSLRLYSVQIPYTWYTIGTAYGNNFFYFKGRTKGIDNEAHDVQIEIQPGNYTPSTLISTVNASIQTVAAALVDTNLGTTQVVYNPNNSMCTITNDLSKSYNESSFSLSFSGWTSPFLVDASRNDSIPAYLGLQTHTYSSNILRSAPVFENVELGDDSLLPFFLRAEDNYITVVLYSGASPYQHNTSATDLSFNISLSLAVDASYNRSDIIADLNTQIQSSPYLIDSYARRANIDSNNSRTSIVSYMEMKIKPNRFSTPITQNTQTFVVFPGGNETLWTGDNSCFRFDEVLVNPLDQIISDTQTIVVSEIYLIDDSPFIELKCILPGFDVSENNISLRIANGEYTIAEYIGAIQTSIRDFDVLNGGYLTGTRAYIEDEIFKVDLVMNKTYDRTQFTIDFAGSVLSSVYGLSENIVDINSSYIISLPTTTASRRILPNDKIASVYYKNDPAVYYDIRFSPDLPDDFYDVIQIANLINVALNEFVDVASGIQIFAGFRFLPFVQLEGQYTTTLRVNINKVLVPSNYTVQFRTDVSPSGSSWTRFLKIRDSMADSPFTIQLEDVVLSKTTLSAESPRDPDNPIEIISGQNNFIRFLANPEDNGVFSSDGANNVIIQIEPGLYSRNRLIDEINRRIQATKNQTLTDITGTRFEIIPGRPGSVYNDQDYLRITFRAKRAYTSLDYNLVFYDNLSFTTCFTGASSVRNTTWDTTIGWIMGFRKYVSYDLSATFEGESITIKTTDSAGRITVYGDTGVSTNLYNYFLICLDDYNQNRLNDGLVTITNVDTSIPLPSYAARSEFVCDPITGNRIFNSTNLAQTEAQTYAANVAVNSVGTTLSIGSSVSSTSYGTGPFVSDVFGLIPIKTSGLINGAAYVEFGGTLQDQERSYFGPVNIQRMTVRLVNDRGDLVDLNNANWSFSLICEQLNKLTP